jgi:hypothetical protein
MKHKWLRLAASAGFAAVLCGVSPASAQPVCPVITLAPTTLPLGRDGVAYSQQITASGGTAPYTFSLVGGSLPPGLTFSSAGLLSGTPVLMANTTSLTQIFTMGVTDGSGCTGALRYVMVLAASVCPVTTIVPSTLRGGTVGVGYSQQITASGAPPYQFGIEDGALPAGLALSPGGLLSGTPTAPGSSTVLIIASGAGGCPGVITYTITIVSAVPALPRTFVILLGLGLAVVGYFQLRRRAPGTESVATYL